MSSAELVASILLNLIPVFAILLFYPLVRKPVWRRLYIRVSLCFIVFWFGYYVLPVLLFGLILTPTTFDLSSVYNPWLSAIGYYITIFFNFVAIFLRTTLSVMPFAFIFAPLISIIILIISMRGEKGSVSEKLGEIGYSYDLSPLQKVRTRLLENAWKEEKEMFKLMIVFLPISLYLLTLVLTIFNQAAKTPQGLIDTGLGVFIEDLVAYVASFLAAVYLLYSSKLSFRGRSLGDRIKFSVDRFILRTGTILALFSIFAFIVQFSQSLIALAYFVIHYVMISVIFAILLPLFEPFGSLILIKVIDFAKKLKSRLGSRNIFSGRSLSALVTGFAVASTAILIRLLLSYSVLALFGPTENIYNDPIIYGAPSFSVELHFVRLFMVLSMQDLFELAVLSAIVVWLTRQQGAPVLGTIVSTVFFSSLYYIVAQAESATNLISGGPIYWITAVPALMTAPGFSLPASRLGTLQVSGSLLIGGAALFLSLAPIMLLFLLTYLLRYWRHPLFLTKEVKGTETIEKAFSSLVLMPSIETMKRSPDDYLITYSGTRKGKTAMADIPEESRKDIDTILESIKKRRSASFTEIASETKLKEKRAHEILRYLESKKMIDIEELEFLAIAHRPALQNLYVTTKEGLAIFNHSFGSLTLEPALVSGMLTAISSFVKEATKSKQYLRTIEHGDVVLIVEFGRYVFATIVADQETPDLRMKLRRFLNQFENEHGKFLAKWVGQIPNMDKDIELAKSIFTG